MDEFRVLRVLRRAIYGQVVLAHHYGSEQQYAIKIMSIAHMNARRAVTGPRVHEDGNSELQILRRLSDNHAWSNEDGEEGAFVQNGQEEEHLANLVQDMEKSPSHQHILTLQWDFMDRNSHSCCLVFDYCPYGELYDQLQRTPTRSLGIETSRVLFAQIVTAIRFIHHQNIAHRDLSLENVLLDEYKQCRVSDFGLATEYGHVCMGRVGKVFYMAPEVYAIGPNETYNGLQADMWSLGILLFILVTGVPPFEVPNDKDARFRLVRTKGIGELLVLWQMENKVTDELRDLLGYLLAIDPMDRFSIDQVSRHVWLQQTVDKAALQSEGNFLESLVCMDVTRDGTLEGWKGMVLPDVHVQHTQKIIHTRKRLKLNIEENTMRPSDDIESSDMIVTPSSGYVKGNVVYTRSQGVATTPLCSPVMIWPKLGIRAAIRSLLVPFSSTQDHHRADSPTIITSETPTEDTMEMRKSVGDSKDNESNGIISRRRRRTSSSASSCSSSEIVGTHHDASSAPAGLSSLLRRSSTVLCRYCLKWVQQAECAHQVTLPTKPQPYPCDGSSSGQCKTKTRRVCDRCYHWIMANHPATLNGEATDRISERRARYSSPAPSTHTHAPRVA